MSQNYFDAHYKNFAAALEELLMGHGTSADEDWTANQKKQVEKLVALEGEFRKTLIEDCRGPKVYKQFIVHIMDTNRNILAARPYFRERQKMFKDEISPLLRFRQEKGLYRFNINWRFIAFALQAGRFAPGSRVAKAARRVEEVRRGLVEDNMPLAISRARIFKRMTPASHLEYMDLIQIANEGLIAAVDKFVLPYTPVFRAVIIGRISGNLIEDYSETLVHFYPPEKRILYKAHKAQGRSLDMSMDHIADKVNEDPLDIHPPSNKKALRKTNSSEIHQLLSAASHVSIDAPPPETGHVAEHEPENAIERHSAPDSTRPDVRFEEAETRSILKGALKSLSLFEKKLLRMKGIEI